MLFIFSPLVQVESLQFINQNPLVLILFGSCFIIISFALAMHIYFQRRRKIHRILKGKNPVDVDQKVVENTLQSYLESRFPENDIHYQYAWKKEKIQIVADLPYVLEEQRDALVSEIEYDLKRIFREIVGTTDLVTFKASFPKG